MYKFFEKLVDPFANPSFLAAPDSVWRFLLGHIRPFRHLLPWMVLLGILKAGLECGLIFYAGRLIDIMSQSGVDGFWTNHKFEMGGALVVLLVVRPFLIWVHHLFLDQAVGSNLQEQVRWHAHGHLLGQSTSYFEKEPAGRLSNRVMQVGQAVEEIFHSAFEAIWFSLVYVVSAIVLLSDIDIRLGLPLAIWLVVYLLYVRRMSARIAIASMNWSGERSAVSGTVVDAYTNIETVKLFADTGKERDFSLSAMQRLRQRAQLYRRELTGLSLGMNLLNGAMIAGVVGPAVWLWTKGDVTLGQVSAAAALTIRLNGMTGWIMWVASSVFQNVGIIRESLASFARPHEIADRAQAPGLRISNGEIRLENVSHKALRNSGPLRSMDLTIPGHQKVGLVGESGSGKSTLIRLVLRLIEPEQGRIFIDGQDIAEARQHSLRSHISVVTQNPSFLNRSVRENLLYGKPDSTEEEMVASTRTAEAHDFITNLVDHEGRSGFDAHIGERGASISGGQRQRLAIARAILKNAPIIIMDEATSALDGQGESRILKNLQTVFRDRTVIAIAHRLSTVAEFDRILVMESGRIVEDGPPDVLRAANGPFAKMWNHQTQLERSVFSLVAKSG